MASGRPVHTISRFVCWAANSLVGSGEFQHLYGTRRPAAIHVGMSPDCSKLGLALLGVLEISIAAGTGADVMTCWLS